MSVRLFHLRRSKPKAHAPTMPTFLPGPAPLRTSGEYMVRPAQSIGAACFGSSPSGMAKT